MPLDQALQSRLWADVQAIFLGQYDDGPFSQARKSVQHAVAYSLFAEAETGKRKAARKSVQHAVACHRLALNLPLPDQ